MKPIDCITVGLSLASSDASLLKYAAMLAEKGIGNRFQFVHVRPDGGNPQGDGEAHRMESLISEAFGSLSATVNYSQHFLHGSRIDQLLAFTEKHPADLVLVGHRNSESSHRSTAVRLAMICPTSVWMIPNEAPAKIESIIAPIDFSPHSADSLSLATGLARTMESRKCVALNVYFNMSTIRYEESLCAERERVRVAYEQFIAPLELHDVNVIPQFEEEANVSNAILRVACEQESDLIVMSTRGRSLAASVLLGSETWRILTESKIPMLAVKHRGAFMSLFQVLTDQEIWSKPAAKAN